MKDGKKDLEYWIWLTRLLGVGEVTQKRLIEEFKDARVIYNLTEKELSCVKGITKKQIGNILENRSLEEAKRILEKCNKNQINLLLYSNDFYPERAKQPKDAPILLYYKGTLKELPKTVGIVGARRCTQEDKEIVIKIVNQYVKNETTVISGMAKGIDSYSHTACILKNGYTISVLGNGLDIYYPSEHHQLMKSIEEKGLLLSEYPPGTPPTKHHFPKRNRIIASWSEQLVVIAAGKKSGAMITANYASQYGRNVEIVI